MFRTILTTLLCLCLLVGLNGCGNKGPLTLPADEDDKTTSKSE